MNINRKNFATRLATIAAGAVLAFGATSAAAATDGFKVSVDVNYADLDLDTKAGAKALYARLETASRNVCGLGSNRDKATLKQLQDARQCYREALKHAVESVGDDALAMLPANTRRSYDRVTANVRSAGSIDSGA